MSQNASEAFAAGSRAFEAADYGAALADFDAARAQGMTGPAIDYNIAVVHYRLGNYDLAAAAFRALGERYAAMRELAAYNRGLSLLELERPAAARAAFEQALTSSDATLVSLAQTMLARLDPATAAPSWLKFFDLGFGHDDNVALLEEASLPAGLSMDSAFTELYAQVSGPYGASMPWRFDASAYIVRYSDAGQFDQTALRLATAYDWSWREWQLEAGPHLTRSTLDGEGFEQRVGAALRLRRALSSRLTFAAELGRERIDALDSIYAFVDGERDFLRLGFEHRRDADRWLFDYRYESNDRQGASVSPTRHRFALSLRHRYSARWYGEAQLLYRDSRYDDLLVPRNEDLMQLSLTAGRSLAASWQLLLRFDASDNDADVAAYAYRRHRFAVSIGRAF